MKQRFDETGWVHFPFDPGFGAVDRRCLAGSAGAGG